MYETFSPLLDALKQRGADPQAVDRAADEAERTGRSIRAVLINDHVVTEEQLTEASADAYGIATLDLVGCPIDPAAVAKIPMALVLQHRVLGIALSDHEITVGITDPGDVLALDDVRAATGLIVRPVVALRATQDHRPAEMRGERPRRGRREPARRGGPDRLQPDLDQRGRADRAVRQLAARPSRSAPAGRTATSARPRRSGGRSAAAPAPTPATGAASRCTR